MILGNVRAAESAAAQGLADAQSAGHDAGAAWSLNVMGLLESEKGNYAAANVHLEEALVIAQSICDQPLEANIRSSLGIAHEWIGDYESARFHFAQGVSILQAMDDPWTLADAQLDVAFALRKLGHAQESARFFRESLRRQLEFGDDYMLSACLDYAAGAAVAFGKFEQATILLGAAAQMRERTGYSMPENELAEYSSMIEVARSGLGERQFAQAWSSGEALQVEDAVAVADRVVAEWGDDARPKQQPQDGYGLSPREREVLRLLATGQSNRAIAEDLFISVPTVKVHVRSILTKLGLESRTAAAAFAIHHHLI
jgi:ATP/maltotriose-dependent transcriptional regulator MalT